MTTTEKQTAQVLSTLNADGSRRWLRPKPSRGRFWNRRRAVAWSLIAIFTVLPYLKIRGKPPLLLDIVHREFTFFGLTLYPTDTLLLTLLIVSFIVSIFLMTALFGRVWCGWACPQTVYMEFLYRPIERFFDGEPGRKTKAGSWRKPAKYFVFLLVSMFLAHIFLAYFVGIDELARWVTRSPLQHPTAFLVMFAVTALMMFDFCFFREQSCIVACPYGRLQSVMLDNESMIVTYDQKRGEPRGRKKKRCSSGAKDVSLLVLDSGSSPGDCIDCHKCVTTCPTGIDIRDGLQMECIGCAQCIDACDDVMDKVGRPRGLIRYSSQSAVEGATRKFIRPRVIVYPLILLTVLGALAGVVATRSPADITILRGPGSPFTVLADDRVANQVRVKIRNRTRENRLYSISVEGSRDAAIVDVRSTTLEPGATSSEIMTVTAPAGAFKSGHLDVQIQVSDDQGFSRQVSYRLLGPARNSGAVPVDAQGVEHD